MIRKATPINARQEILKPKSLHLSRQSRDYAAPRKVCAACSLREQCTKNRAERSNATSDKRIWIACGKRLAPPQRGAISKPGST